MTHSEIPIGRNTGLEVNILRHGKTLSERLGKQTLEVRDANPELSEWLKTQPRLFADDKRIKCFKGEIYQDYYSDPSGRLILEEDVPEDVKVIIRHWSKSNTLPDAIRKARRVNQGIGEDLGDLRAVTGLIRRNIRRFQSGAVGMIDQESLLRETAEALVQAGFDTALKPEKIQVATRALEASVLTDSTSRPNISQARMRWIFALYDSLPLALFYPKAKDKWEHRESRLLRLFERESFFFEELKGYLEEFGNTNMRSHEFIPRANALKEFVNQYITAEAYKTNPNREAALYVRVVLVGPVTGNERAELEEYGIDKYELENIFGADELIDKVVGGKRHMLIRECVNKIDKARQLGDKILLQEEAEPQQEKELKSLFG